jgi:hypothetical protein|tara:strand:+ start:1249 stop:1836 length:588 start_codon:yes stop_codon:yes gene_type:complete
MKKQLHDYEGYTAFERHQIGENKIEGAEFQDVDLQGYEINGNSVPAFYYMTNAGWVVEDEVGFSGWKVVEGEGLGTNDKGKPRLSTVWETSWWHSIEPNVPRKLVGGPFRAAIGDYTLGINALFYLHKFCPIIDYRVTYDKAVKIGEVMENLVTDVSIHNGQMQQECVQRIYGTDKIVGHCWTNHHVPEDKKDEV